MQAAIDVKEWRSGQQRGYLKNIAVFIRLLSRRGIVYSACNPIFFSAFLVSQL
jgi:hypothetical protein